VLTEKAERDLAYYDGNYAAALAPVRRLRERFTDDANLLLEEMDLLERLGRNVEARALTRAHGGGRRHALTLQRRHAEVALEHPRLRGWATRQLRRLLRLAPEAPEYLRSYANTLWGAGAREEALPLYRYAATAADKNEEHWRAYASAARYLGRSEDCLALLRARFAAWGGRVAYPALTLQAVLKDLDRDEEADAVLAEALRGRPEDGDLLLPVALNHARRQRPADATREHMRARGRVSEVVWVRCAARIAELARDYAQALAHWRELLTRADTDGEAHEGAARMLALIEGRPAALAHMDAAVTAQAQNFSLASTRLEWLRSAPAEAALAAANTALQTWPDNAWLLRERAYIARRLGRPAEGEADGRRALELEPRVVFGHGVLGRCLADQGRRAEARAVFRQGLALDIDATYLFDDLTRTCENSVERRAVVEFLAQELMRQRSQDGAVLAFVGSARGVLTPAEWLAQLRSFLAERPEDWASGSALAAGLLEAGDCAEALTLGETNCRRYPLMPRVWLDLAEVHKAAGRAEAQAEALRQALVLNPTWGAVSRNYSAALEALGRPGEAEEALRRAIKAAPLDAHNHGWLADLLWRQGRHAEGVAAMQAAVQAEPEYDWAWNQLQWWSQSMHDESIAIAMAKRLTQERPGEPAVWRRLAMLRLDEVTYVAENLAALDRALALAPLDYETYDLRAEVLARAGRWAEARLACVPLALAGRIPHWLMGRAAWVEARAGEWANAIERMQAVLQDQPDYAWGWARLTEWQAETGKTEAALVSAQRWADLAPRDPIPLNWMGRLLDQAQKKDEAKRAFEQALARAPDNFHAARYLLEHYTWKNDQANSERLLTHVRRHGTRAQVLSSEVIWHASPCARDRRRAVDAFGELLAVPAAEYAVLERAHQALSNAGWAAQTARPLRAALTNARANPNLAYLWIAARQPYGSWSAWWVFLRLKPVEPHTRVLTTQFINLLVERRAWLCLRALVWCRRASLHADHEHWAEVGVGWLNGGRPRKALRWFAGWARRPAAELQGYMLANVALAHFQRGQSAAARVAVAAALRLPPSQVSTKLTGWLALEQALAGEVAAADATLASVGAPLADRAYDLCLHDLTTQLIAFARAPDAACLLPALERVDQLAQPHGPVALDAGLRLHARRVRVRLAELAGRRREAWWQQVCTGTPAAPAAAAGGNGAARAPWAICLAVVLLGKAAALLSHCAAGQ
jgi:cellulose synthase operon protein C